VTLDLAQLMHLLQVPMPASPPPSPLQVQGVSNLELASDSDLCFAEDPGQVEAVRATRALVIVVPVGFPPVDGKLLIPCPEPRRAFFRVAEHFVPLWGGRGIHPSAVIEAGAELAADVEVGPCAVIAAGASVAAGSSIGAGCFLGPGVTVGTGCLIEPNVTLHRDTRLGDRCIVHSGAVLGGDGFGFHWDGSGHRKIPQLGRVVIEDDVEIGCNVCVDRATLGETRVRRGTKIDNLVQVAHNVQIGKHCAIAAQTGIAGSSELKDYVQLGGNSGVSDHITIGMGARVAAKSGAIRDVPPGVSVAGLPALEGKTFMRREAALKRLPEMLERLKALEAQVKKLEAR
jgi:UDP-3-O-[3-hydroxymyristoyl] glucosamine N-acyltransferase